MDKTVADEIAWLEEERWAAVGGMRYAISRGNLDAAHQHSDRAASALFRIRWLKDRLPALTPPRPPE